MIQFILMLLGLAFSNNNAHTATCPNNDPQHIVTLNNNGGPGEGVDPVDTGGDTGQTPPR